MDDRLRKVIKKAAYFSGALSIQHARENRGTLTAVMFHRVLDTHDPRWVEANPTDTVSTDFFADCLRFFRRHYDVVSLDDVMRAMRGGARLPSRGILITFDDGWSDNLRYAAPLLRAQGLPAAVFITVDAVARDDAQWWQERVFGAFRSGAIPVDRRGALKAAVAAAAPAGAWLDQPNEPEVLSLIARLSTIDADTRSALLAELPSREQGTRMMLSATDLPRLHEAGIDLGVHGFSHAPLTMLTDAEGDLVRAREGLRAVAGDLCEPDALAIPHGRFDDAVAAAAERVGFTLIFTSEPHINRVGPDGVPKSRWLGRIVIEQQLLSDARGRLKSEELATWLFRRPIQ